MASGPTSMAAGLRGELSKQTASLEDAVFGVLYTLSKEKGHENKVFVVMFFMVEFVQLMLFSLSGNNTNMWGWNINYGSTFWKWLNYFQLENPMTNAPSGSYSFWLAFFYILVFLMAASLGLCVYVAICFKSGSFPYVWPVKLLRAIVSVIFSVLFVSALDVFLVGVACVPAAPHTATCVLYNFPTVKFDSFPELIHGIIGIVMSCLSITISYLLTIGDSEQNVLHHELLGSADSMVKSRRMMCCTLITLLSNFLIAYNKLLSLMLLTCFGYMLADQMLNLPYHHDFSNYLSAATGSLLAWGPLLLVVKMYTSGPMPFYNGAPPAPLAPFQAGYVGAPMPAPATSPFSNNSKLLTEIGFYAAPFVSLLCLAITWARLRRFKRMGAALLLRIRQLEKESGSLPDLHELARGLQAGGLRFGSVVEVEIVSRVARQVLRQREDERDPAVLLAAEAALALGVMQFEESSLMNILYACFLMDVCGDHPKGYSYLDKARALTPTLRERFMIFARDRERTQRAQGDSMGGGSMDLVSYVEFQSSFANLQQVHRAARRSNRNFWRLLVNANVSFRALSQAFESMDSTEAQADRLYRTTLMRYPRSVKLLRAYGGFLEEVRNNPWAARKMCEDADKLEESQTEMVGDTDNMMQVNEKVDAVCVINPNGIITITNKILLKMFGYKHAEELEGKNVSVLMPAPFSQMHDGYLKRYMATGRSNVLGSRRKLEARHKDGHAFAISLLVTKMETGNDISFMAVITAAPPEEVVLLSVSADGIIVDANDVFQPVFRRPVEAAVGKPLASLLTGTPAEVLEAACRAAAAGSTVVRMLDGHARGGASIPMEVVISPGSASLAGAEKPVLGTTPADVAVRLFPLLGGAGQIVIDDLGQIKYSDAFVGRLFGRSSAELLGRNVSELMPRPYSAFHGSYLAENRSRHSSRVVGAEHARRVSAQHRDGRVFPMMLTVAEMSLDSGRRQFAGRVALRSAESEEPLCLRLTINDSGEVLSAFGPTGYFQLDPDEFIGQDLEELLSWRDGDNDSSGLVDCLQAMPPHVESASQAAGGKAAAGAADCAPMAAVLASAPPALSLSLLADGGSPVCVSVSRVDLRSLEVNLWSQAALDCVCAIDAAGRIVSVTHGLCLLLGYFESDLLGRDVGEAMMPAHIAAHHQSWVEQVPLGKDGRPRQAAPFRRVVDAIHRSGAPLRVQLEVATASPPRPGDPEPAASAVFVARFTASSEPLGSGVPPPTADDRGCPERRAAWIAFRKSPSATGAMHMSDEFSAAPSTSPQSQPQRDTVAVAVTPAPPRNLATVTPAPHTLSSAAAVAPAPLTPSPARHTLAVVPLPPPPRALAAGHTPELSPEVTAAAPAAAQAWALFSRNETAAGTAVLLRYLQLQPAAASLPPFAGNAQASPAALVPAALVAMRCASSLVAAVQPQPPQALGAGLSAAVWLRRAATVVVAELSPHPAFASVEPAFVQVLKQAFLDSIAMAYGDRDTPERAAACAAVADAAAAAVIAALPPRHGAAGPRVRSARLAWDRDSQWAAQEPATTEWASSELHESQEEPFENEQLRHGAALPHQTSPSGYGAASPPVGRALYDSLWGDIPGSSSPPRSGPVTEAVAGSSPLPGPGSPAGSCALRERTGEEAGKGDRGYPADVVARARRGHCIFFADPEPEEPPAAAAAVAPHPLPPGASAASCPFLSSRAAAALPGPVSESVAAAAPPAGGCVFAQALKGPPAKLPPGMEVAMAVERLLAAQRAVAVEGGSAAALAAARTAAAKLQPRSEREWEELLRDREIRWRQRDRVPDANSEDDVEAEAEDTEAEAEGSGSGGARTAQAAAGPVTEAFAGRGEEITPIAEEDSEPGGAPVAEALEDSMALARGVKWRRSSDDGRRLPARASVAASRDSTLQLMGGSRSSGGSLQPRRPSVTAVGKRSSAAKPLALDWKRVAGEAKAAAGAEGAAEDDEEDDLNDAAALAVKRDAEFQRARRFRQVLKLLNSLQMRRSVALLRSRTRYVLVLILSAYIGGFITLQVLYSRMTVAFTRILKAGTLTQLAVEATTRAAQVEALVNAPFVNYTLACFRPSAPLPTCINAAPNASNTDDVYSAMAALSDTASSMAPVLHGMRLGFNGVLELPDPLVLRHLTTPSVNTTIWVPMSNANASLNSGFMTWRYGTPFDTVSTFVAYAKAWGSPVYGAGVDYAVGVNPAFIANNRSAEITFLKFNGPTAIFPTLRTLQDLELQEKVAASAAAAKSALIIVIAVILVFISASAYFSRLLEMVARARINLFMVFLVVPQSVVLRLATRSLKAVEDDDVEDDEAEDDWAQKHVSQTPTRRVTDEISADGATPTSPGSFRGRASNIFRTISLITRPGRRGSTSQSAPGSRPSQGSSPVGAAKDKAGKAWRLVRNRVGAAENRVSIDAKGREMDSAGASSDTYSFMLPLVIWGIIAITTFVVTYTEFTASIPPMISMNAAALTDTYATRVRMYAHALVVAAARGAPASILLSLRADLAAAADDLLSQHETVLRTGGGTGVHALVSGAGCLRTADPRGCALPGDPWEPSTQHGLDTLVRAYVQQARALATQPVADVSIGGSQFAFIWSVGGADVHDGLQSLVATYLALAKAPPAVSNILQITFVPVLFFGNVLFVQRFFRPWVKRTMLESRRVAELLAQLPNEVSVEALVLEAMGRGGVANADGVKAAMRGHSAHIVDSARGSHEDELRYALGHHKVEKE